IETAGPLNELGEPLVQFKNWPFGRANDELFFSDTFTGTVGDGKQPFGGEKQGPGTVPGVNLRGPYQFFPYVPTKWENRSGGSYDSTKDAWTFQENLWVTRELYRQLRTVNAQVVAFQVAGDPKTKVTARNPYWQLDMEVDGTKVKVKAKN